MTIRFWVATRISLRKNRYGDPEIKEALACADRIDQQHYDIRKELGKS